MRVEIVAVGTELLLGQIADTNRPGWASSWPPTASTSHFHQAVGDNHDRITLALRTALARSDGVIVCGGLGPTQDDITRDAIAEVMNVELVRDAAIVDAHRRVLRRTRPAHVAPTMSARPTSRGAPPSSPRSRGPHRA